jgi:hypothetical protein
MGDMEVMLTITDVIAHQLKELRWTSADHTDMSGMTMGGRLNRTLAAVRDQRQFQHVRQLVIDCLRAQ